MSSHQKSGSRNAAPQRSKVSPEGVAATAGAGSFRVHGTFPAVMTTKTNLYGEGGGVGGCFGTLICHTLRIKGHITTRPRRHRRLAVA